MTTLGFVRDVELRTSQRPAAAHLHHRRGINPRPFTSSTCVLCVVPASGLRSPKAALPATRGLPVCHSAAVLDAAPAAPTPKLAELALCSIINTQGMVLPEAPEGTRGAAYAIYDEKQKLQYVGTTTDLRNALRTALGRRPEKSFYYKATCLTTNDPAVLTAVRDSWFAECGGQPNGNRLAIERSMWQQPVDAGAISERGRKGAAEEKARQLQGTLRDRGCKEEFTPNATLLLEGQVEFLPALNLSDEEMAAEREAEAARMRGRRSCSAIVDGQERIFHTLYGLKFPTKGGVLVDVSVLFDGRETQHRVIVGKQYFEPYGLAPEAAVEAGLALLLRAKVARATEGMLLSSQFPVNYFALGQVEQWYGEEFRLEFERVSGGVMLTTDASDAWRFNRIHDYGPLRNESAQQLDTALGQGTPSPVKIAVDNIFSNADDEDDVPTGPGILDAFF